MNIYVNGQPAGTEVTNGKSFDASGATVKLGSYSSSDGAWFKGTMEEVRISDTARSSSWIKTCYNNQSNPSTFYTISEEELY